MTSVLVIRYTTTTTTIQNKTHTTQKQNSCQGIAMRGFKHNEPLKFILKYFQTKIRCKNVLTWLLCISSTYNEMLLVIFWGFNFLYILFCIYIFWGFFHRNKNKEHPQKISKPIWLSFVIVLFIIRVVRIFFLDVISLNLFHLNTKIPELLEFRCLFLCQSLLLLPVFCMPLTNWTHVVFPRLWSK